MGEGIKKKEKLVTEFVSDRPQDNEKGAGFLVGWSEASDKKKLAKVGKGKSTKQGPSE